MNRKSLRLPNVGYRAWALAALVWLGPQAAALAQQGEAPATSRGENFSNKPPAQLFQSDCTGSGCHSKPQGLAKAAGIGLAGFLREHYTNSRESAAALANYLMKLPSGPEPKEKGGKDKERETRASRSAPAAPSERAGFSSAEPSPLVRPERGARTPPRPNTRTSRAPARPEEEAPAPHGHASEPREKPAPASHASEPSPPPAATAAAPGPGAGAQPDVASPPPPAASPPPSAPAHAAAPAGPKQFDIFD